MVQKQQKLKKSKAKKQVSFTTTYDRVYPELDSEQPSITVPQTTVASDSQRSKGDSSATNTGVMGYRVTSLMETLSRFRAIKIAQLVLAIYITVLTFADIGPPGGLRDTETGLIVDKESTERTDQGIILVNGTERAIAASTIFQVGCIGVARISAWLMYPVSRIRDCP